MVALQYNAQGIDPEFGGFSNDPIWTEGWNRVIIFGDRVQELNDNKGKMLLMSIRSVEGPDVGKTGTVMCNIWHNDPASRDRAIQQMAALCFAVGVGGYNDTQEIWNRPFWIENKTGRTRKAQDGKEYPQNNFTNVRNNAGVEPGKSAASAGPQPGGPPAMPQGGPAPGMMPPAMPQGGAPQGNWQPQGGPAPTGQPGWGPTPPQGVPAAPSYAAPAAPAGGPAPQQGWAPAPPQQAQPQPQPQQQPQQAGPGQWQPNGAPPAGGPGWGPR